jgi:hypothetical protein
LILEVEARADAPGQREQFLGFVPQPALVPNLNGRVPEDDRPECRDVDVSERLKEQAEGLSSTTPGGSAINGNVRSGC